MSAPALERAPDADGGLRSTVDWTTDGIAETLPGVLPPLRWAAAGALVEEALRNLLDDLGGLSEASALDQPIVSCLAGRAALRTDAVDALTRVGADAGHRSLWRRAGHDMRLVRLRRVSSCEAETCIVAAAAVVDAHPPIDGWPDDDVLAYRRRLLDLAGRTATAEAGVALAASAAYQHLERSLVARLGEAEGSAWARRLTTGAAANASTWMRDLIEHLHRTLAPDRVAESTTTTSWERARVVLGEGPAAAVLDAARRAGSCAVFAGPTWDEDPSVAWSAVRLALTGPKAARRSGDPDWARLVATLRALPGWGRTRLLTGQVIDIRLHVLRRLREDAIALLDRRERTKAALLGLGGEVRRTHLELGRRLYVGDLLGEPGDVELLTEAELVAALAGRPPAADVLERRRRQLLGAEDGALAVSTTQQPVPHVLAGVAASPGRFRGPARVLRSIDDEDRAEPGAVLVARTTDPSWTFLLMEAGAIVVEQGSMLSHAAILARELQVPAVTGIPGVVDLLASRACDLDVDGDAGTVTLLPPSREGGRDER